MSLVLLYVHKRDDDGPMSVADLNRLTGQWVCRDWHGCDRPRVRVLP